MMISRWSSPIPRSRVWPVIGSWLTLMVGSSRTSLARVVASLAWSALVLGSIVAAMTGSGKRMDSRTIGWLLRQSVSPVEMFFIEPMAAMSPAPTSLISFLLLACISRRRESFSSSPLVEL